MRTSSLFALVLCAVLLPAGNVASMPDTQQCRVFDGPPCGGVVDVSLDETDCLSPGAGLNAFSSIRAVRFLVHVAPQGILEHRWELTATGGSAMYYLVQDEEGEPFDSGYSAVSPFLLSQAFATEGVGPRGHLLVGVHDLDIPASLRISRICDGLAATDGLFNDGAESPLRVFDRKPPPPATIVGVSLQGGDVFVDFELSRWFGLGTRYLRVWIGENPEGPWRIAADWVTWTGFGLLTTGLPAPPSGTWYFTMSAVDWVGNESSRGNVAAVTVP